VEHNALEIFLPICWHYNSESCICKLTDTFRKSLMRLKVLMPFLLYTNGIVLFVKEKGKCEQSYGLLLWRKLVLITVRLYISLEFVAK